MRVSFSPTGRVLESALLALTIGGAFAASCTFDPGPPGSTASTGSATGQAGSGVTGGANSGGQTTGAAGSTTTGAAGSTTTGAAGSSATGTGGAPAPGGMNCGLQTYGLQNVPPDL